MWVLILSFAATYAGDGVALTTQEFTSRDKCISAATLVIKQHKNSYSYPKAICVPK